MCRVCWIESQEFVKGNAQHLADEIVQRHIDCGPGGGVEPDDMLQVVEDILNDKWIITEIASKLSDTDQYRLHTFSIEFVGRCFAVACVAVVVDLDNCVRCYSLHPSRYTEWCCESEVDWLCVNMHVVVCFLEKVPSCSMW